MIYPIGTRVALASHDHEVPATIIEKVDDSYIVNWGRLDIEDTKDYMTMWGYEEFTRGVESGYLLIVGNDGHFDDELFEV